jgi:DNA-binding response OmpR family regulator
MLQHWTAAEAQSLIHPQRPLGSSLMPRKVMVLEDDLCLETLLNRVFYAIDPEIEVHWVTTGDQAIADLADALGNGRNPYDLIVADISTPGKQSGLDFWRLCRLHCRKVPFVFISSMPVDQFLRLLGPSVQCPPYLPKPFSVGECRQVIEGLLAYGRDP